MKPRIWPVLVTLFVALTLMLSSGAMIGIVALALAYTRGEHKPDIQALVAQPLVLLMMTFASQATLLLSVRVMPPLLKDVGDAGWFARVNWRLERFHPGRALLAWFGTMGVGQVASWLLLPLISKNDALARIGDAARNADLPTFSLLVVAGGALPGLVEELMFRGLVQRRFVERWGPVAGIALAAFLFGAYHLDLRQGLAAMAMGWWLGWFAWRDGSVVNVACGHALNNTTAFIISRAFEQNDELDRSPWVMVSGLVLVGICVALTTRFVRAVPAPALENPAPRDLAQRPVD